MNGQDNRLKYMDLFRKFEILATDVRMSTKVSQRNCERLAKQIAATKAKTPEQFEKIEALKEFVMSTSVMSERMIETLNMVNGYLVEIANDCTDLINVAELKNKIEMQSETIAILLNQDANVITLLHETRANIRANKATA